MHSTITARVVLPLVAVLIAAILFADLQTPLGYAEWALYLIPMALTMLQPDRRLPWAVAVVGVFCMAVGYVYTPGGGVTGVGVVNRSIGSVLLFVMASAIHAVLTARAEMRTLLWRQQAEKAVAQALIGELGPEQIGERATAALCGLLEGQVGVLYRLDGQRLLPSGGHALDPTRADTAFDVPHGLPGQVATDGRARCVEDLPAGHLPIVSALGRSDPGRLLIAPLTADRAVCGVIEIGLSARPDAARTARDLALLEAVAEPIGTALRTAIYRQRLVELLRQTQAQSEQLQAQQEELRVTNEELEEQSRALAESQARLEAQQVELEQSNVRLEEQKESLERQKHYLVQAQNTLRANAEQLEEASRYKSEFLANMSHELRTPLNSALILSKLLADNREGTLTAEQVRYAEAIHAANNDLLALINDVLDLSKIEAGHVEINPESVELDALAGRLRTLFEPLAQQKKIGFEIDAQAAPPRVVSDPLRLQQVLKNLLANAVKFTERGRVRLAIRRLPQGRVAFAVEDTGVGIAKAQQEVIFEAFRQADGSTSRKFGGTGLGLSISRELARRLGGDIVVDSEPGRGSTFTLTLPEVWEEGLVASGAPAPSRRAEGQAGGASGPAAGSAAGTATEGRGATTRPPGSLPMPPAGPPPDSATPTDGPGVHGPAAKGPSAPASGSASLPTAASAFASASASASAPVIAPAASASTAAAAGPAGGPSPSVAPSPAGRPGRGILIVEDDPAFGRLLLELARERQFEGRLAPDGASALGLARELQPSGILLDIGLPDQSGLAVLEQLKRDPQTRHIPVHVISAHAHGQTARELGAVGYLTKPVERDALVEALESLQQRMQRAVRRLLIVEDDEALRHNLELLLGGEQVQITAVGTIAAALEQLAAHTFDCMVMDLALPDGTGYDLLERIAAADAYAFPPVIVYTGRALSRDEEQRLRRHSKSIIVKGARSPERLLDEVTLFLHSVEARLPADQQQLLRRARQRDTVLDGRRILLAEDDVRNIFALSSVFEPLGAQLVIARNGREALDKLAGPEGGEIDLVLMDIMMPEMDGLTAMRHIREQPRLSSLPVIALTAKAMSDDRERCLEAGASDYIAKPIDIDKLVSLCRVWMPK